MRYSQVTRRTAGRGWNFALGEHRDLPYVTGPASASAAPSGFDRGDVDLSHLHHGFERALRRRSIRIGDRGRQGAWRDLPRQSPLVLAPAACAFLTAVSDNRVPQAIRFGLVLGRDLEREGLAVFERRPPVQAETRDTHHRKFDRQDIALLARGIVARGAMDGSHRAVREGLGVKLRGVQRGAVVPETNRVLADHLGSPELEQIRTFKLRRQSHYFSSLRTRV